MDEQAGNDWLATHVSREKRALLDEYTRLLQAEAAQQNLISATSGTQFITRHIVDSAQLVLHAPDAKSWLDLGSGAGLPGIVTAILTDAPTTLVESRRLRSDWLTRVAAALNLTNVRVEARALERVGTFTVDVITARAFAPLARLLPLAVRFAHADTVWILPKGRTATEELASIDGAWQGHVRMEPSLTDPASAIIVATGIVATGTAPVAVDRRSSGRPSCKKGTAR